MKKYRRLWPLLIAIFISIPTLFLIGEDWYKAVFIVLIVLLWGLMASKNKNPILTTLLFTIFILSFNISLLLPTTVNIFETISINFNPFVDGIYSNYLVPTISILDIFIVLLLCSFLISKGNKYILSRLKEYKWLLISLFIFIIIQNLILADPLVVIKSLRFITYLKTFLLVSNWIKNEWKKEYFKQILIVIFVQVLIQGIIGILQFNGGSSLGLTLIGESQVVNGMQGSSFISLKDGIYLRAYGTFPHPNVLGGFYILSFVLGWISINFKKYWKYFGYVVMTLSVIFSLFTFSRIVIAILIFGVLLFIFSNIKKDNLFAIYPTLIFERFMNLFVGGDTSWNDRVNLFKSSIEILKNNWLLGTGIGNFVKNMENNIPRTGNGVLLLQPVHNVPVLIFSEFGVFGGLLFLLLIGKYLFREVRWKENVDIKVIVIFSLLVIGMFDHYLLTLPQGMVIGMLLTIGLFI